MIFDELAANDVSQNGKQLSPSYLKHLLNVRDGGQCRIRNVNLNFHPFMPRILCINDEPEKWLKVVEGINDVHETPLKKRLFFGEVNEFLLDMRAVEAHEEELDALVADGKRRRLEQGYGEVSSTTASGSATPRSLSGSAASSSFGPFGHMAPVTPPLAPPLTTPSLPHAALSDAERQHDEATPEENKELRAARQVVSARSDLPTQ